MAQELTPTQQLVQFVTVFLNRDLTPENVRKIQFHLLQEVHTYQKKVVSDWCASNGVCENCAEKLEGHDDDYCGK